MKRFLYTIAYLFLLGVPAVILTLQIKEQINFPALLLTTLVVLIVGGIFDIWAVKQSNNDGFFIWEYNSKSILGFKIYGVPIEDFVFFLILTPIFVISIYEGIKNLFIDEKTISDFVSVLILFLIITYYLTYKHAISSKRK